MRPIPANPRIIIAQVDGSGTPPGLGPLTAVSTDSLKAIVSIRKSKLAGAPTGVISTLVMPPAFIRSTKAKPSLAKLDGMLVNVWLATLVAPLKAVATYETGTVWPLNKGKLTSVVGNALL